MGSVVSSPKRHFSTPRRCPSAEPLPRWKRSFDPRSRPSNGTDDLSFGMVRWRTDAPARPPQSDEPVGLCRARAEPTSPVSTQGRSRIMNRVIWLVGAVVIILLVLSFFGLR
jgi:hypothetical protein